MTTPNGPGKPRALATVEQQKEHDKLMARFDAALKAGWIIHYDPLRDEYSASRAAVTMRSLEALLGVIEAQE